MIRNSSVNFNSYIFYFGQKDPIKVPILAVLSSALVKICQIRHVIFQTTSQFFFKFCTTLQCHERWLLCTLLGRTLNSLHKRNQSKCKFLRLLSARVKINQILVIFETNQFFFKFCITLQGHETYLLCTFLAEILYTFNKRSLSKYKFGEMLCESQKSTLMGFFCSNHAKFQLKKYRRVISHDTEDSYKV